MRLSHAIRESEAGISIGRLPGAPRDHWTTPGSLRVNPRQKLACPFFLIIGGEQ